MANLDYALILPISDIDLRRDQGRKLRVAGYVTAIDPDMSTTVVLSEIDQHGSILVDLSLCTNPEPADDPYSRANAGGWRHYSHQQQRQQMGTSTIVPPTIKSVCMVLGYLRKHKAPIDTSFLDKEERPTSSRSSEPLISDTANVRQARPNDRFYLEAILVKELDHTFDLKLWNYTARLRSQHEWKNAPSSTHDKGKQRAR